MQNLQKFVIEHVVKWIESGVWVLPDLNDSLDFLATEVAEAIDLRLRQTGKYFRSHERDCPTDEEIALELADAFMMICISLDLLGIDLANVVLKKISIIDENVAYRKDMMSDKQEVIRNRAKKCREPDSENA